MSIYEEKNDLEEITVYSPFLIQEHHGLDHTFPSLEACHRVWGEQYSEYYKYSIWVVKTEKIYISQKGHASG